MKVAVMMKMRVKFDEYYEESVLADLKPAAPGRNTGLKAEEATYNNSKDLRLIGRLNAVSGTSNAQHAMIQPRSSTPT